MSDSRRFAFMRVFRIADNETGELYLWRLRVIETPWFGILLHRILKRDGDRHMHDHPFSFLSIPFLGSYNENFRRRGVVEEEDGNRTHRRRSLLCWNWKCAETAHQIVHVEGRWGCFSLVLRGPRRRRWGFHTEWDAMNNACLSRGWTYWRTYLDAPDGTRQAQESESDA